MARRSVAIANVSAFWGDTPRAVGQVLGAEGLDYLVGDYLAEITMSILARYKSKSSELGYVPDFISAFDPHLREIAERGIKTVVNAGGLNPRGCKAALERAAAARGVSLKIATVVGDDLMALADAIRERAPADMFSGAAFPGSIISMNAYLGAFPIAEALALGADVVITGRCNDAALVLGPLIHELGWKATDLDALAGGSLAGHIIECGTQCTGGAFTDWKDVPGWENMGFPIATCFEDGSFEITKPDGTGGLVSRATVAEQLVYEIGDPAAYVLPDVVCDFTEVTIEELLGNRVRVRGAKGREAPTHYKVSATHRDGHRLMGNLMIAGFEAEGKARRLSEAVLERAARLARVDGFSPFSETSVEVMGTEESYGASRRALDPREVVLKIGARHAETAPLEILGREIIACATSTAQGVTGIFGGRPKPSPVIRLFSFLIEKERVPAKVLLEDTEIDVASPAGQALGESRSIVVSSDSASSQATGRPLAEGSTSTSAIPLRELAVARSGDKGNDANIGVIARSPELFAHLREVLTPALVRDYLSHFVEGEVERFELPGIHAFNFLLHRALGGGGVASLRYDPQGKAFAQILLDLEVPAPAEALRG